MASHHHHHLPPISSSCCNGCCPCPSHSFSSPPPAATHPDPLLLQAVAAAQILHSQSHHHHRIFAHQYLKPHQDPNPHHHPQTPDATPPQQQVLIQSLIRRIAALESSLPPLSPSSSPPPLRSPQQRRRRAARGAEDPAPAAPAPPGRRISLLQNSAARIIQTRFRLHLVRRSQTLRHLQRLAPLRSRLAAIKSSLYDYEQGSLSSSRHLLHPKALYQQAMDLLLQLDSIQSQDSMIREGKRSISNELVQIMEYVDRIHAKRLEISLQGTDNGNAKKKNNKQQLQLMQDSTPNQVKRVVFAGDGDAASGAFAYDQAEVFEGNSSSTSGSDEEEDREDEEDHHLEAEEDEEGGGGNKKKQEHIHHQQSYGSSSQQKGLTNPRVGLYAPLPVKMEARRGRGNGLLVP